MSIVSAVLAVVLASVALGLLLRHIGQWYPSIGKEEIIKEDDFEACIRANLGDDTMVVVLTTSEGWVAGACPPEAHKKGIWATGTTKWEALENLLNEVLTVRGTA